MTSTARQLRQPPTIKAIERVPYFADVYKYYGVIYLCYLARLVAIRLIAICTKKIRISLLIP